MKVSRNDRLDDISSLPQMSWMRPVITFLCESPKTFLAISDAVEIEYDDRHTAEGLREVKETTPKPNGNSVNNNGKVPAAEEDDGDDLDIDDI